MGGDKYIGIDYLSSINNKKRRQILPPLKNKKLFNWNFFNFLSFNFCFWDDNCQHAVFKLAGYFIDINVFG